MNEFTLHPHIYATAANAGLVDHLKATWTSGPAPVDGHIHIVSGFGNYNGGVRFFDIFRRHILHGGRISAFFAGSAQARLTSRQLVEELLNCGVDVTVVNRKRLLHAKLYGTSGPAGDRLIVTSGNFTGPGMTQNVEAAVSLDEHTTAAMNFSWTDVEAGLRGQVWDYYYPSLTSPADPAWQMLYDEVGTSAPIEESEFMSMILTLGHADTVRINAPSGSTEALGSQYFWLSKDGYGFFPALTIRNARGHKATYSAQITVNFLDIGEVHEVRVTFEAENNLDFRLGTGPLRRTGVATTGDIAVLTRRSAGDYELRIARAGSSAYGALYPYATDFIGHQGKKYGYVPNEVVDSVL